MLQAAKIATGHNADDIAETVLLNILRGDLPRLSRCTAIVTGAHVPTAPTCTGLHQGSASSLSRLGCAKGPHSCSTHTSLAVSAPGRPAHLANSVRAMPSRCLTKSASTQGCIQCPELDIAVQSASTKAPCSALPHMAAAGLDSRVSYVNFLNLSPSLALHPGCCRRGQRTAPSQALQVHL